MSDSSPAGQTAEAIRVEAARAGLSLREIARRMGRAHTYVTERARGVVSCDVDDLAAIAGVLGIPMQRLLPVEPTTPTPAERADGSAA